MAIYRKGPGITIVLVPVWLLMIVLLASGVGVVSAGLTVRYRDVNYFVPFMLQFLLFASPVGYPPIAKYQLFYDINPLTWLLNEFRWAFLNTAAPPLWQILLSRHRAHHRLLGRDDSLRADGARLRRRHLTGGASARGDCRP